MTEANPFYSDHMSQGSMGTNPLPADEVTTEEKVTGPPSIPNRGRMYSFPELVPEGVVLPCDRIQEYAQQYQEYIQETQQLLQLLGESGVEDPESQLKILRDTPFYCPVKGLPKRLLPSVRLYDTFEWQKLTLVLIASLVGIILLYKIAQKHCFQD